MLNESLKALFNRDLNKLKVEIESYQKESNLWIIGEGTSNSAGNLCLHLIGNTNGFIGAQMGKTGYVRQRDLEFSLKNVPRAELLKKIEDTIIMVDSVLGTMTAEQFEAEYPIQVFWTPNVDRVFFASPVGPLDLSFGPN